MQHAEDPELSKDGMINDGIISTKLGIPGISDLAEKIVIEQDLSFWRKQIADIIFHKYHRQNL